MKRILTLLLVSVGLFATSCKKETIIGPSNNQTIVFTVNAATDWVSGNSGATYSTTLDVPEIDTYVQNHDAILVYISFDNGVTFEQVPEVYGGTSYSFSHVVGGIQIDGQSSDGSVPIKPQYDAIVKVVIVDSN